MVSKRWQRTQNLISHVGLAMGAALPFFFLQTNLATWQKLAIVFVGYLILIPLIRALHKRFAKTFIKVFRCEYDSAAWIVQRALTAHSLPFTKQWDDEQVIFKIHAGKMNLAIDAFPLNMMVDDHLASTPAAKLTLQPETDDNAALMGKLQQWLDEAFAAQGA